MTQIDPRILGTWKLVSTKGIDDDGMAQPPPYGPAPNGVVCFQPDGRMYCVLCDGRSVLPEGESRQFMSYAGNYTFDGTTLTTRVDASQIKAASEGTRCAQRVSKTTALSCRRRADSMPA